jgi:hypothetical protein
MLPEIFFFSFLLYQSSFGSIIKEEKRGQLEIHMPHSKPELPETYLCTPFKLDVDKTLFITGFEPKADRKTAHHMLLFGCKMPGKNEPLYHCGAMDAAQAEDSSAINPCGNGTAVIYAWALNAPKLHLPKDVAFQVGGPDSDIDWLVLQVTTKNDSYNGLPLLILLTLLSLPQTNFCKKV